MTALTTDALVEAMALAHYNAVNLRVHQEVVPTWERLPQSHRDWFIADMRAALAALVEAAGLDREMLRILYTVAKGGSVDSGPKVSEAFKRHAALLRALAGVSEGGT